MHNKNNLELLLLLIEVPLFYQGAKTKADDQQRTLKDSSYHKAA
jgi:hypothetical protein